MQMQVKHVHCCGIRDLKVMNSLRFTPKKFIQRLCREIPSYQQPNNGEMKYAGFAHYTLSVAHVTDKKTGTEGIYVLRRCSALSNYIAKHKLGTVVWSEPAPSPTYGGKHMIKIGFFTPDQERLIKFGRENGWIPKEWKKIPMTGTWD